MPFNSFNFWLIFPFIFVMYWTIPKRFNRARNIFLILVSYLLYMNWKPAFAVMLVAVTAICYAEAAHKRISENFTKEKAVSVMEHLYAGLI